MPKKGHRDGGKFSGSHTTIIEAAEVVVDAAAKRPEVSKICLRIIVAARSRKKRLKFKPILVGWEMTVYGNIALQTIYIHTSNPETTKEALEKAFAR